MTDTVVSVRLSRSCTMSPVCLAEYRACAAAIGALARTASARARRIADCRLLIADCMGIFGIADLRWLIHLIIEISNQQSAISDQQSAILQTVAKKAWVQRMLASTFASCRAAGV